MSYVSGYANVVDAVVPEQFWENVFFSLESLKAHLQSVPGYQRMDVVARDDEISDQIFVTVMVFFEHQDQLLLWLRHGVRIDQIFEMIDPDLENIKVEVREIV